MQNSTPLDAGDHGTKTCAVCCLTPGGLILEGGYVFANSNVVRTPSYKRLTLAGPNRAVLELIAQNPGMPLVSSKNFRAGITVNCDEAFVDAWIKSHADSNIVRNRHIWKCKNLAEAQASVAEDFGRRNGWEPLPQVPVLTDKDKSFGAGFVPPNVSQVSQRTEGDA